MEPEDTIDYNLRKTWFNISKMYNRTASDYMGSMSLAMIVLNIDMFEGTPSTQLGPNMGMESTSLSRSLNKLEDLLKQLQNKTPISCKDVTFKFFGLSLATINTVISIILSGIMFKVIKNYGKN
mgnify:CR=1 FL=1